MANAQSDSRLSALKAVPGRARDVLGEYRAIVADTGAKNGVPEDKKREHLEAMRATAVERLEALRRSLDEDRRQLTRRIDAELTPSNGSEEASAAFMHRFERAADLGPDALLRSVGDTLAHYADRAAPEAVETVAQAAESVLAGRGMHGLVPEVRMVADRARRGLYTEEQRGWAAVRDELDAGCYRAELAIAYALDALTRDDPNEEVILPGWDKSELLVVGAPEPPRPNPMRIAYHLRRMTPAGG